GGPRAARRNELDPRDLATGLPKATRLHDVDVRYVAKLAAAEPLEIGERRGALLFVERRDRRLRRGQVHERVDTVQVRKGLATRRPFERGMRAMPREHLVERARWLPSVGDEREQPARS